MPPSTFAELEQQAFFRATLRKRNLLLLVAFVLDLAALYLVSCIQIHPQPAPDSIEVLGFWVGIAFHRWTSYAWLGLIVVAQLVIARFAIRQLLSQGEGMIEVYPSDKSESRRFGGYTAPQLVQLVHQLIHDMDTGKVRQIVISDRPEPNAFTAHVVGYGNVVVLHSNLLEVLPPEGVKAVVAHEVGHIRRRDSIRYLVTSLPRTFLAFIWLTLLWKIGVGIVGFEGDLWLLARRMVFLFAMLGLTGWLFQNLTRVANLAAQQSEHLADAYAAQACGWLTMLNAMLLLGDRIEALYVLMNTLKQQPHLKDWPMDQHTLSKVFKRFPARELDEAKARKLANRLYIESQLAELKDSLLVPFSDEQIIALAAQADQALRQKNARERQSDAELRQAYEAEQAAERDAEQQLIEWRKYDADRSGHLDAQEFRTLARRLREQPHRMLYRMFLEPTARWQRHPTMRDRLLYLYNAFEQTR